MIRRVAGVVLAALLIGTVAGIVDPPRPASAAGCEGGLSSTALNDMIRGGRRGPGGVAGMDYAHVHQLPDGRVLWLFQDAFLGDVDDLDNAAFVHNAALIQFGSCVKVLNSGTTTKPTSWIGGSREIPLTRWFWPLDGVAVGNGLFRQFMVEMSNPNGTGAALGATPVRVWIASIRLSDLAVVGLVPAPDDHDRPLYGFSITSDDDWTYLYGNCYRQFTNPGYAGAHDLGCGPDVYVARVPRNDVRATPRYWNGVDWVGERSAAAPIMERGLAANPMQVRRVGDTYVAVTKIDDWFGLRVYVDTAPSATGPWTEVSHFEPDPVCGGCTTYFAYLLPWRDANGSMLVSISNNAWSVETVRTNPVLYRPRVISVKAPPGVQFPAPPADCAITSTLRKGQSGTQVRCLRRRLAQLGYDIDGSRSTFDAAVKNAVVAFQSSRRLGGDGVVGATTGRALGIRGVKTVTPAVTAAPTSCRVTSTLRAGSSGSQVACLNARLSALGYTITGSTSSFGASTRASVRAFQTAHGLAADGIVGPGTRRALGF